MKNFESLGLHSDLLRSINKMGYEKPTPIQAQAIPIALDGRDIMGSAQTGTGKTAAFAIPVIEKLMNDPNGSALILTPTRELGKQIMDIMRQLIGSQTHIKSAFIIGGESIGKQFKQLRANPRLIVGTPGRVNDHLKRGSMVLKDTDFIVLDETDRMLDMGFSVQLEKIFKYLPAERQTLMFSATLPKNIIALANTYLNNPERVAVGSTTTPIDNIQQDIIRVDEKKKYDVLTAQLEERSGTIIIFAKTKFGTERLAKRLSKDGFKAEAIHGDMKQSRRERVIHGFRNKKFRILVATDVVARGLDVPHVQHVINFDLPQVAEDYIHRIGRTARAGSKGYALCLIAPQDGRKWFAIEQLIDPDAKKERYKGRQRKRPSNKGGARRYRERNEANSEKSKDFKKQDFKKKDFKKKDRCSKSRKAEAKNKKRNVQHNDASNQHSDQNEATRKEGRKDNRWDNNPSASRGRFKKNSKNGGYKKSADNNKSRVKRDGENPRYKKHDETRANEIAGRSEARSSYKKTGGSKKKRSGQGEKRAYKKNDHGYSKKPRNFKRNKPNHSHTRRKKAA